jgi:hypothetical protein
MQSDLNNEFLFQPSLIKINLSHQVQIILAEILKMKHKPYLLDPKVLNLDNIELGQLAHLCSLTRLNMILLAHLTPL